MALIAECCSFFIARPRVTAAFRPVFGVIDVFRLVSRFKKISEKLAHVQSTLSLPHT